MLIIKTCIAVPIMLLVLPLIHSKLLELHLLANKDLVIGIDTLHPSIQPLSKTFQKDLNSYCTFAQLRRISSKYYEIFYCGMKMCMNKESNELMLCNYHKYANPSRRNKYSRYSTRDHYRMYHHHDIHGIHDSNNNVYNVYDDVNDNNNVNSNGYIYNGNSNGYIYNNDIHSYIYDNNHIYDNSNDNNHHSIYNNDIHGYMYSSTNGNDVHSSGNGVHSSGNDVHAHGERVLPNHTMYNSILVNYLHDYLADHDYDHDYYHVDDSDNYYMYDVIHSIDSNNIYTFRLKNIGDDQYLISSNGLCITYMLGRLVMQECDGREEQVIVIEERKRMCRNDGTLAEKELRTVRDMGRNEEYYRRESLKGIGLK